MFSCQAHQISVKTTPSYAYTYASNQGGPFTFYKNVSVLSEWHVAPMYLRHMGSWLNR